eukprot:GDKH01001067.1.p2 GENE.GDKH01001067.1~~GDKH01001067.1.p2  ORF type:complete len:62 (-),score=10.20 GDKH01001067.1:11-196(-)
MEEGKTKKHKIKARKKKNRATQTKGKKENKRIGDTKTVRRRIERKKDTRKNTPQEREKVTY